MRSSSQVMTTSPAVDQIDPIILAALAEDLGDGDVTTLNTIPPDAAYTGDFLVKAPGVIAGLQVAQRVSSRCSIPPSSFSIRAGTATGSIEATSSPW